MTILVNILFTFKSFFSDFENTVIMELGNGAFTMKDNFNVTLGSVMKSIREKKNITQPEAAAKLGVSKMTISHWETGARAMTAKNLSEYCKVLGVSIQSVFERM